MVNTANGKLRRFAVGVAMFALVAMPAGAFAQDDAAATAVSGFAFGVEAEGDLLTLEPTPSVVLPEDGGTEEDSVADFTAGDGAVTAELIEVMTTGSLEDGEASSMTTIAGLGVNLTVAGVAVPLITSETITVTSSAVCDENGEPVLEGDTLIEGLVVGDEEVTVDPDEPNQTVGPIEVPGVGSVTLTINEQIVEPDAEAPFIIVNGVVAEVELADGTTQTITLASAGSDIVCADVLGEDDQQDDDQQTDDGAGGDDKQGGGDDKQGELPTTGGAPAGALLPLTSVAAAALAGFGALALRRRS